MESPHTSQPTSTHLDVFSLSGLPNHPLTKMVVTMSNDAEALASRVLELQGTSPSNRNQLTLDILEEIETNSLDPNQDFIQGWDLWQSDKKPQTIRKFHADAALRQAVHVAALLRKTIPCLSHSPGNINNNSALQLMSAGSLLENALSALEDGIRHTIVLDAHRQLGLIKRSERGRKGGHAKPTPPSSKNKEYLISCMIEGILYNNPSLKKLQNPDLAAELAIRIYRANREYQFLDITLNNNFKSLVYTNMLKILKTDGFSSRRQEMSQIAFHMLRHPFPTEKKDALGQMELELARNDGYLEGVREVFLQQMMLRFGELPENILSNFKELKSLHELETYLIKLPNASTIEEVISINQKPE